MTEIRIFGLVSVGAIALATSSAASAASYLFDFQIGPWGPFGSTNIVYAAESLDPTTLTYVSGSVNGASSPTLGSSPISNFRRFQFANGGVPDGEVAGMQFTILGPFTAGQSYSTGNVFRLFNDGAGSFYGIGTSGQLTITERIAAVPEPSTWALLILGFGGIGFSMRLRMRTQLSFA